MIDCLETDEPHRDWYGLAPAKRSLWLTHMNNDFLKAYMEETDGAVDLFTLNEMSKIA